MTAAALSAIVAEPFVVTITNGADTFAASMEPESEVSARLAPVLIALPGSDSTIFPFPLAASVTCPVPERLPLTVISPLFSVLTAAVVVDTLPEIVAFPPDCADSDEAVTVPPRFILPPDKSEALEPAVTVPVVRSALPAVAVRLPVESSPPRIKPVPAARLAVPPTWFVSAVVNLPAATKLKSLFTLIPLKTTSRFRSLIDTKPVVLTTMMGASALPRIISPLVDASVRTLPEVTPLPTAVSVMVPEPSA